MRGLRRPTMKRPYLALATFALVAGLTPGQSSLAWATGLFGSAPVNPSSFAVLARPVGESDWTLVVLEQLRARPFCWTPRPDGLVDPTLNRFNYTGICGRFIDSNGYSLRIGDVDLNHAYRLRLQQNGRELRLLASPASQRGEFLVGRGSIPRRDRDLFVSLQLEPGWELRRRLFGERSLSHVYFANGQSLDTLMAASSGRAPAEAAGLGDGSLAVPPEVPPPLLPGRRARVGGGSALEAAGSPESTPRGWGRRSTRSQRLSPSASEPTPAALPGDPGVEAAGADGGNPGVVALQVIPYEERNEQTARSQPPRETRTSAQGL